MLLFKQTKLQSYILVENSYQQYRNDPGREESQVAFFWYERKQLFGLSVLVESDSFYIPECQCFFRNTMSLNGSCYIVGNRIMRFHRLLT